MSTAAAIPQTTHGDLVLVADIGGTNARFALAPLSGGGDLVALRRWKVSDFDSLAQAIAAYLGEVAPRRRVRAGMVAVAGPATGDEVRITNSRWQFSVTGTGAQVGFDDFFAINDFAANSWGVTRLRPDQLVSLGGPLRAAAAGGICAVVGPGTGLGVSGLITEGERVEVLSSEGGHVDFAPVSDEETTILAWLKQRHHRVSYERLVCGAGLHNVYRAIGGREEVTSPEQVTELRGEDAHAARAIRIFCEVLGSFAGNVALMFGAWQGVYLAGGMLLPLREELLAGHFRRRFDDKGRFGPELAKVPAWLVDEPCLGLVGAAAALRDRLARA